MLGTVSGNTIEGNIATGNGLLGLAPSLMWDLFDAPPLSNTWARNEGRFNLAEGTSAVRATSALVAQAFGPGGCMADAGSW